MALVVGTNSWATRAEADTYLEDRVDSTSWFALADTPANPGEASKDSYLITAYFWLFNNPSYEISDDSSDPNVKNAQIEASLFLIKYQDGYEKREALIASGVKSFERSEWQEDLSNVSIPDRIHGMLIGYYNGNNVVQLYPEDYEDDWT